MLVPLKNAKTYGVLHTENYFSFLGFSKKVSSEEIQKVDVYLDDELIDTIIADKHLQKIEDIYELENFGFSYVLPNEYIGKKNLIYFKNHETKENLQNSPYELIKENHPKFNEMTFLNSIELPIDEEKITNTYSPNSIGFLATEENLDDKEFVEYINQIMRDFPNCTFKALVFNDSLNSKITNLFSLENLEIIQISNIYELVENIEIYLSNYERTFNNNYENRIIQFIRKYSTDIFGIGIGLQRKNISIYQLEINNPSYFQKFFDNLKYLGFDNNDITKYGKTYHEIYFKKACDIYGVDICFDMNENVSKACVYWNLKLGLANHEFFKYSLDFAKKFAELQK